MPVEVVWCPEIGEGRTPGVCGGRRGWGVTVELVKRLKVVGSLSGGTGGWLPREGKIEMFFLRNAIRRWVWRLWLRLELRHNLEALGHVKCK